MRIISKFHDYYDCIQSHGIDKSLVYLRQPKDYEYFLLYNKSPVTTIEKTADIYSNNIPNTRRFKEKFLEWKLEYFIVGFCGEWYIYAVATKKDNFMYTGTVLEKKYLHSAEEVKEWVTDTNWKSINSFFYDGKYNDSYLYDKQVAVTKKQLERVFSSVKKIPTNIFIELKTPIITFECIVDHNKVRTTNVLRTNGCLKDIGFHTIKDPYTCYQEISMYIGGVLGIGEPCTVNISDVDMRDKKGFNDWSFKTMPGTKKPRRKNK